MKLKNFKNIGIGVLATCSMLFTSCINDLDVLPPDPDVVVADQLYVNQRGYEQVLAKVYGGLALTGQQGPAGDGDVAGFWRAHQLPAVVTIALPVVVQDNCQAPRSVAAPSHTH